MMEGSTDSKHCGRRAGAFALLIAWLALRGFSTKCVRGEQSRSCWRGIYRLHIWNNGLAVHTTRLHSPGRFSSVEERALSVVQNCLWLAFGVAESMVWRVGRSLLPICVSRALLPHIQPMGRRACPKSERFHSVLRKDEIAAD